MGQAEHANAGPRGRDSPTSAVGPMAGDPVSEMPVTLVSATSASFLHQKERGGERSKGSPALGPRFGVWDDRSALCFESRVLLTPSNFTLNQDTRSLFFNIYGEWPSRATEGAEWLAH